MTKPKIGVIGSGGVGRTLGGGLAEAGYEVRIGTSSPAKVSDWVAKHPPRASSGSFQEAATFGDVLIFAVKGTGAEQAIKAAGAASFQGKTVLDTTNPLTPSGGLFVGGSDSLGERIQRLLPEARVVKVFNSIGSPAMVRPNYPDGAPDLFLAGNDERAKGDAKEVAKDLGWSRFVDVGGIEASRYLEGLAMVYILNGRRTNNWSAAWKLLGA